MKNYYRKKIFLLSGFRQIPVFFIKLAFLYFIFASPSAAQYRLETWTTEQGLPYKIVKSVLQTRDGYVWAATDDGLARFDGVRFTVFNTGNTKNLPTNRLNHLVETADGSLWMASDNRGLIRCQNGIFTNYTTADGLPDNRISHFVFVAAKNLTLALVFLTMHKDETMFNAAMDVGVKGYVLKDSAIIEINDCIKTVACGKRYITPALSDYLFNRSRQTAAFAEQTRGLNSLTNTERRVLQFISEEKTSKEIGEILFIHPRTVDNHRTNICQKLDIHGSNALLRFALTHKSEIAD